MLIGGGGHFKPVVFHFVQHVPFPPQFERSFVSGQIDLDKVILTSEKTEINFFLRICGLGLDTVYALNFCYLAHPDGDKSNHCRGHN